jgi:hypothetical protein
MKACWHRVLAGIALVFIGALPSAAHDPQPRVVPPLPSPGGVGGIGGTGPLSPPLGWNTIGGVIRPGDMGAPRPSGPGSPPMSASPIGSNTLGGSGPLTGLEPGGVPGSGGMPRRGTTRNAQDNAPPLRSANDLGIVDPFAAAGTGVGGPATDISEGGSGSSPPRPAGGPLPSRDAK